MKITMKKKSEARVGQTLSPVNNDNGKHNRKHGKHAAAPRSATLEEALALHCKRSRRTNE